MKAPNEIYLFQSKNDGSVGVAHHKHPLETEKTTSIKYIRADLAELTWEKVQDIWLITDKILRSIPDEPNKWSEEWMFNTQGRFTKALDEINKHFESKKEIEL